MKDNAVSPTDIRSYRRLAGTVVEHHFGKAADRIVYKRSGLTNYVFLINHIEGQFVVRISPDVNKIESFRKELWVTQKVREAGVPTQEVLHVGNELISQPYMIARRVSGHEAINHPRGLSILHQIGRYAAIINSVRTKSFGRLFDWANATGPVQSWREYLQNEWRPEERLEVLQKHKILPVDQVPKLRRLIDEVATVRVKPALSHGDLRMKNVIVDEDGHITAIIDWDDCLSTMANAWELSIALHDLNVDEKHALIEGYGYSNKQLKMIAPIMRAFNILNYTGAIEAASNKNDVKALQRIRLRLGGHLDLYSL